MSCSLLILWLWSLSCPSYGDVIYGISYLYSLKCFSCKNVICGTIIVCVTTYTIVGTTFTTVGIANGSTLPPIIFYAFKSVLSCSFFTPKPEAPPSSTLFFFLKALLGESVAIFSFFSSVIYISSLVFLTLANGFYGLSF